MVKISIITPTYNRGYCIERAIRSVKNLSIVKNIDYEYIIIDDGSIDNTSKIISINKHEKLKYVKYKINEGVNSARNKGINIAKGDYVLFLDSDDELMTDSLIKIKNAIKKYPNYKIYRFLVKDIYNTLVSKYNKPYVNITYKQKLAGTFYSGEFISLIKKEVLDNIRMDNERMAFESIFWNRVSKKYNSEIIIPEVIRIYHTGNKDRLCNQFLKIENAKKRANDYIHFLSEFENDYINFGLIKQLNNIKFITGLYLMVSEKKIMARFYFTKNNNYKGRIALILSYLGSWIFKIAIKIYRKY